MNIERRLLRPRYLHHWALLGLLRLVARLPFPVIELLGRAGGTLLYWFAPFRREVAATNIRLCFPHLNAAQQRALVKATCYSNVMGLLETAIAWWSSDARLRSCVEYVGFERLQPGTGAILLGCHLTTLDLAGRLLSMNADVDVVYRRQKYPVYDFVMRRSRKRFFKHVIERSDTRQLVRSIRQGRVVWYAPDQDYGRKNAVFAPFFGVPAATLTATSRLAKMTGAPVFICTHYRIGTGKYRLIVSGQINGFPSGDDIADATRINRQIEDAIRVHPEQYMWLHKRFKTQPEGKASFYPQRSRRRTRSRYIA